MSAAVLKHGKQHAGEGGEQQYEVGYGEHQIDQGMQVAGVDVEQHPPHMRQCRYGKERRCPAAQPERRRDAGREGITLAQQQVERGNQWHHSRDAIEDEKQYRLCRYLSEHIHIFVQAKIKRIIETTKKKTILFCLNGASLESTRHLSDGKVPSCYPQAPCCYVKNT